MTSPDDRAALTDDGITLKWSNEDALRHIASELTQYLEGMPADETSRTLRDIALLAIAAHASPPHPTDEAIETLAEQFIDYGDGDTEQTVIDVLGFARALLSSQPQPVNRADGGAVPVAISHELRQEAGKWCTELSRAYVYLDAGEPFFSGKDCSELAGLIMALLLAAPPASTDAVPVATIGARDLGLCEPWNLMNELPLANTDAVPVLWQEVDEEGHPILSETSISDSAGRFDNERPLYATPIASALPAAQPGEKS